MSAQTDTQENEASNDGPLLDLTDAGVKKFIKQAKTRGYVTMEDLNKVLPSEEVTPDQIEDTPVDLSHPWTAIRLLIDAAADINQTDATGRTPLNVLCCIGWEKRGVAYIEAAKARVAAMDAETSGRDARTLFRDKTTGALVDAEELARRRELANARPERRNQMET